MPNIKAKDVIEEVYSGIRIFQARLDTHQKRWQRNLGFYHGTYDEDSLGNLRVISNLVFGLVQRIIPAVYFKNPHAAVNAAGSTPREMARLLELALNFIMQKIGLEGEMRKVVFDALFKGIGIGKVGLTRYQLEQTSAGGGGRELEAQLSEFLTGMVQQTGPELAQAPEAGSKEDLEFQEESGFDENVHHNKPYFKRIPPEFFAVDRYATTLDEARWCAQRILLPRDEAERRFKGKGPRVAGIQATVSEQEFTSTRAWNAVGTVFTSSDGDAFEKDLMEFWEVWYKPNRKVYCFSTYEAQQGEFKPLEERDWPYDFKEFPYEDLRFNADPDDWFGVADVSTWDTLVRAYNWIQTKQALHIQRFNRKYVMSQHTKDEGSIEGLTSGEDGAVITVPDETPEGKIVPLQDAPVTADLYMLKQHVRDDLTFVSGVTYQRQGYSAKGDTTATEASILESVAQLRDNDRLYLVTKYVERVARKLLQLARQAISLDDVAFFTGRPEIVLVWKQISPQVNEAEVDVSIRVGATAYKSHDVRLKQFMDILMWMRGMVDTLTGIPLLNAAEAAKRLLEDADIESPEALLVSLPGNMLGAYVPTGGKGVPSQAGGTPKEGGGTQAATVGADVEGRPLG